MELLPKADEAMRRTHSSDISVRRPIMALLQVLKEKSEVSKYRYDLFYYNEEADSSDLVPGKEIHWLFSGSEKSEMIFNIILMFADHYSPAPTLCSFPSTEQLNEPLNNEAAEQPQEFWGQSCPYGWTLIDRRCFIYVSRHMDWASAESHCLSLGANLVSVHSEYEYQRVKALIRSHNSGENPTWLGLSSCEK
ncbi:hypothetical protein NFI96_029638, partial [Prochilodus magdalenae]